MTCTQVADRVQVPDGIELLVPTSREEVWGMLVVQHAAYGDLDGPREDDLARSEQAAAGGMFRLLARDVATGEPAGGGVATGPGGSVFTEVAGIG